MTPFKASKNQAGVAVVIALLLTTLAVTIVANLFWVQQVHVRMIENQRTQSQKQWILRAAVDWAMLIVREDAKNSSVDYIGEPWSTPFAETRLDEYVENKAEDDGMSNAVLSGDISDAQARYNLENLADHGVINPAEVHILQRLFLNLKLDASLAQPIANAIAATQMNTDVSSSAQQQAINGNARFAHQIGIMQDEDLLAVPGLTEEMYKKIRNFVIVLPHPTPLNVNTAPAEILAASVNSLSMADAVQLVSSREHAYFKDASDFSSRLPGKILVFNNVATYTNYFLVDGKVRIDHASLHTQALIERNFMTGTRVVWMREI